MRTAIIGKKGLWIRIFCLTLLLGSCERKTTPVVPPDPEPTDPVLQVQVPGAYGIPGGNQVYNEDRHQLSTLESPDGSQIFLLLDPGERKVMSIHGIPASLKAGDRISFHFRVMTNGYVLQSEEFEDVELLKVTDKLLWLKKDANTYFVLAR